MRHDWEFKGPLSYGGLYRYKCLICGCHVDSSISPDPDIGATLEIRDSDGYARKTYPYLTCGQALAVRIQEE